MKLFKKFAIRIIALVTLVFFLVGCDQATKQAAYNQLKDNPKTDIAGIVHLQYIENDGGMLSLGSNLPEELKFIIFILVVSVFLVLLFLYIIKNKQDSLLKYLALIFIFSGGLGNLIDRVFNNGNVIDFIRIRLPLIESRIFNIADFYVTMGFMILLITLLIKKKILIKEDETSL
jgi:signal peptidase II